MTAPPKATPAQWEKVRLFAEENSWATDLVLLEVADRVAALEAAFASHGEQISGLHSQHNLVVDTITDLQGCVNQLEAAATPSPAPAGDPVAAPSGLVERVLRQLPSGTDPVFARQAILEVAEWADEEDLFRTRRRLREEAIRPTAQPTPSPAPASGLLEEVAQLLANRISAMPPGADCTPLARTVLIVVADAAKKMVPDPNLTWTRVAIWLDAESEQ